MTNLVKWGSYEAETAAEEKKDLESGSAEFFKVKGGKNVVRFLPPPVGKKSPFRVVWQHYVNLPGVPNPVSFPCPMREASRACPVCAKAEKFKKTGNDADYKKALDLFPKRRVYANIIDREAPENGVQIYAFGKMVHEALVKIRSDEDAGGDFCNPDIGFDIIIDRKGTGKNDTEYTVMAARKQSKLGDYELIAQQQDLERFAKVPSDAEIMAKLAPGTPGDTSGSALGSGKEKSVNAAPRGPKARTASDDVEDGAASDDDAPF
jgi:hypothetical protein